MYQPKGFFTPPYETEESLRVRLPRALQGSSYGGRKESDASASPEIVRKGDKIRYGSKKILNIKKKSMSMLFRGKAIFKPLNTGQN